MGTLLGMTLGLLVLLALVGAAALWLDRSVD